MKMNETEQLVQSIEHLAQAIDVLNALLEEIMTIDPSAMRSIMLIAEGFLFLGLIMGLTIAIIKRISR